MFDLTKKRKAKKRNSIMSTNSRDKQRKLTTTPLSKVSETPDLLSRRKRHRSRKRSSTKEEIQYQRFVHDLQKNMLIQIC